MLKWLFQDGDPSTLTWSRYRLLLDGEGDDPGAGTGGGEGEPLSEGEHINEDQSTQHRGGSDRGRVPGHMIPKYRFDEVNQRYRPYREIGLPADEIKAKLARLAELESKPENYYTEDRKKQVREDLLRVFPELRTLVTTHESNSNAFVAAGVRQTDDFLKSIGVEVNERNNRIFQEMIGGMINQDPELSKRFYARDASVFGDAIKSVRTLLNLQRRSVPGLDLARGKTPARASQPTNDKKAEGDGQKEIKPGPLFEREVLDQAGEQAFARISQFEE